MLLKCLLTTLTLAPTFGLPFGSTGSSCMVDNNSFNISFGGVLSSSALNSGETAIFDFFSEPLGFNFVFNENNDIIGYELFDSFDNSLNMYRVVSNAKCIWIDAGTSLQKLQVNCYFSFVPNLDFINLNLSDIQINNLQYLTTYCNSFFYENQLNGMNVINVDTDTQHFIDSSHTIGVTQLFTTSYFSIPEYFNYLGINCDICFDYSNSDSLFDAGYAEGYNKGIFDGTNRDFNISSWLLKSIGSIMDFEIFPNFSISVLLLTFVGALLGIYILRLFAGG